MQSPPNGFQQRGHTQGGPLAATSNYSPGETTQEVKLLQETLNRAAIVPSSKLRETIDPIHQESLQAGEWSLSDNFLLGHQIFINMDLYKYMLITFKEQHRLKKLKFNGHKMGSLDPQVLSLTL